MEQIQAEAAAKRAANQTGTTFDKAAYDAERMDWYNKQDYANTPLTPPTIKPTPIISARVEPTPERILAG